MCDITAPVLSEMCGLAKSLQAQPTLDSPLAENWSDGENGGRRNSVPSNGTLAPFSGDPAANKRKTMTGFSGGSGSQSERSRNKGKGRVQIAVAQLHLIAGRVPDAMKE